jgi:hypothetical protein
MAFACIYVLTQWADPAAPKMQEKKKQKLDFDYFRKMSIDYL